MNKKTVSILCAGVLAVTLASGATAAIAAPSPWVRKAGPVMTDAEMAEHQAAMLTDVKAKLAALVADGKITQAEADAALATLTSTDGKTDFSALPEAVREALMPARSGKGFKDFDRPEMTEEERAEHQATMLADVKAKLAALVADGKITQAEADATLATLTSTDGKTDFSALPEAVREALMPQRGGKGFKDFGRPEMTEEERAERQAAMLADVKAKLAALVAEGKITQAEADAALAMLTSTDGKMDFSALPEAVREALMPTRGGMGIRGFGRTRLAEEELG